MTEWVSTDSAPQNSGGGQAKRTHGIHNPWLSPCDLWVHTQSLFSVFGCWGFLATLGTTKLLPVCQFWSHWKPKCLLFVFLVHITAPLSLEQGHSYRRVWAHLLHPLQSLLQKFHLLLLGGVLIPAGFALLLLQQLHLIAVGIQLPAQAVILFFQGFYLRHQHWTTGRWDQRSKKWG